MTAVTSGCEAGSVLSNLSGGTDRSFPIGHHTRNNPDPTQDVAGSPPYNSIWIPSGHRGQFTHVQASKGITAEEFMRKLESDPAFARRKWGTREATEGTRGGIEGRANHALTRLSCSGRQRFNSVGFGEYLGIVPCCASRSPRSFETPVFRRHSRRHREGAGCSGNKAVRWDVLVDEFEKTDASNKRVKDGLAVALAGASDDAVIF